MGLIDVHLVQDESHGLRTFVEILGPLLIAGAAVFAAQTARKSAAERQEKQLAHDTERQEEALAHDRAMRDRESTAAVIDQAIEAAHQAIETFKSCELDIKLLQGAMGDPDKADRLDEIRKKAQASLKKAAYAVPDLGFHQLRISSRPGASEISTFYGNLIKNYEKHRDVLAEGVRTELTEEQLGELEQIDEEGTVKMAELLAAWYLWLEGTPAD